MILTVALQLGNFEGFAIPIQGEGASDCNFVILMVDGGKTHMPFKLNQFSDISLNRTSVCQRRI
jgi:hypothetical protein